MSRRTFHFSEGTSNKFWSIEVSGSKTLVHFGKIGTTGQAQEKDWGSDAAAQSAGTKLIAEKAKKGYQEQAASGRVAVPQPIVKSTEPKPKAVVAPVAEKPVDAPSATCIKPSAQSDGPLTLNLERSIDLKEEDWHWASWRPRKQKPKPEVRPFDREVCLKLAREIVGDSNNTSNWNWKHLDLSKYGLSPEESALWLYLGAHQGEEEITAVDRAIREWKWQPESQDYSNATNCGSYCFASTHFLPLLIGVLGLESALDCLGAFGTNSSRGYRGWSHMDTLGEQAFRWLECEEADAILSRLRALPPLTQPADKYESFPPAAYLLAALGASSDVKRIVASIPNNSYGKTSGWEDDYYQGPQILVFALASPTEIVSEMRRIGVRLRTPEYVTAWLATTEYADLDFVAESIIKEANREEATKLMRPFMKVHAIEAVPAMFRLILESKVPGMARQWLSENPHHAVVGAANLACGRGKLADAATEFLHELIARGQRDLLLAAMPHISAEAAEYLQSSILAAAAEQIALHDERSLPSWAKEALPDLSKKLQKLPANEPLEILPVIALQGRGLPPAQVNSLCTLLAKADPANPPAIFAQLKQHATQASLDAFSWKLFSNWLSDAAPPKEKWAMLSLGYLGGDAIALKLAPMVRKWPGESQHQRAVLGLQVLRLIGTDTALMQLNGIAQKVPFKGLKERARELMDEIAKARGLTKAQLEDRIVPDCGLDAQGKLSFDFGSRQFELLLSSDLKPMIRDSTGKKRPDLPAPNSSDDATKAEEAVAEWKILKKNLREILKIQTERLEQAMVTGRRWSAEEFDMLLVKHPLMTHFSRWVIWACYDAGGKITHTFRVNDDQTLADANDDTFHLPAAAQIGLVHALQLDEGTKNAWGQVLGDYEIIQPFPQLGRPVFGLQPDEKASKIITRGKGKKVAAASMYGVFEKNGWQRDMPADAGGYSAHSKQFPAANVTAFAHYEPGMYVGGGMADMDDQEVTEVYFVPGMIAPDWWSGHTNQIPLPKVDPIVLSEVLRDLETILSKAK
jgi:predicted DNA-binding WGR domain protein